LNPGFDGKLAGGHPSYPPKIVGAVVTEVGFLADSVVDLSPVRALADLNVLDCSGTVQTRHTNKLLDLSPLAGLKLTQLKCSGTQIFDLTPIEGLPLKFLDCSATPVSDLAPLRGMPLTTLRCSNTEVSDLSPLEGMMLHEASFNGGKITNLAPLQGMPLAVLGCHSTAVSDLSPLIEMQTLSMLYVQGTKV
jgi:Leucine-rich repeat (LRR) protein